jgi:hypothetical protein
MKGKKERRGAIMFINLLMSFFYQKQKSLQHE